MIFRRTLWLVLGSLALLGAGCATAPSGTIAGVSIPAGAAVTLVSTPFYPIDAFDVEGKFLNQLRGYGLVPTSSADAPFAVRIYFTPEAGDLIHCRLELLRGKVPVLAAEGSTPEGFKPEVGLPAAERRAAFRQSAFEAAARNFAAKARTAP